MVRGMTQVATPDIPNPQPVASRLRSIELQGPAGRLEALLNEGAPNSPFAALVCHPHPVGGGTMHNKVVYHAMKTLNAPEWGLQWPVLRFNFRGTGLSEGRHDGMAESGDVRAALAWLENAYHRPILLAGFSFGAAMSLKSLFEGGQARALALLGLPTQAEGRIYRYPYLAECRIPKLFLSGDRDQFAPAPNFIQVAESAAAPRHMALIAGADHFFTGQLERMQDALAGWLKELKP